MRAIKIVAHGGVEGLEVGEVEPPQATGDRVRVHVAALNSPAYCSDAGTMQITL